MELELADHAKPIAALGALLLLSIGERLRPASPAGQGTLRHDLSNLSLGALNGLLGLALAAWLLPLQAAPGSGLLGAMHVSGIAYWILGFVLLDLWMFVWHRLSHGLPLLWRVHRAHHSDVSMDASTALRFHPIETTLSALLRVPVAWALGLGLMHIVIYEVVLLPVILFHHSNLRVPVRLDRVLRWVVVTPALHRIHHSPDRTETDSNFGAVFTIWDRLLRTLRGAPKHPEVRFGVAGFESPHWQSWSGMLVTPFRSRAQVHAELTHSVAEACDAGVSRRYERPEPQGTAGSTPARTRPVGAERR